MTRNTTSRVVVLLACLFGWPAAGFAQSAITGTVRDASGAVLPGVTVEASSEALIEKSRNAVTDGQGAFRIVDLRPGYLSRHLHADGLSDAQARGPRAALRLHDDDQRGLAGRLARGIDHGHRRCADRRRHDSGPHAGDQPGRVGRHPDRRHHSGRRTAGRRRQPEPPRRRRRPRHAADLHGDAWDVGREQHRPGGRDDGERPAGRRRGPELLQ